jgi:hypothetical protein
MLKAQICRMYRKRNSRKKIMRSLKEDRERKRENEKG